MAKYFARLLLLVAAVIGLFAIIGSLLPRDYDFESTVVIQATPDAIFPYLDTLKEWPKWSKQFNPAEIENLEIKYNAEATGIGAAQTWTDSRGGGKLWITSEVPNESIDFSIVFSNFPEMRNQFLLEPVASGTSVTWSGKGSLPSGPFYGFFGFAFAPQMKHQFSLSLEKLKQVVEQRKEKQQQQEPPTSKSD